PSQLALAVTPVFVSVGFLLWALSLAQSGRLPDPIATHWNAGGEADGFSSLGVHLGWAVFALVIPTAIWVASTRWVGVPRRPKPPPR
ncbi:MAG: DUF1648 domain-containing protein, partial [Gammaproteobacteria bacterium]|nr:DUF1648 domain-containing protein [Gammaproteobacteria bacterium]